MAKIVGTLGDDIIVGVDGTDNLIYGDTDGTLSSPATGGNDTITGGANGTNTILHISQFLETFSDLNIEVVGTDSVIHFDANNSVTVLGVTGLTASDFHFVV
jgi:hypothetical protein